MLRAQQLVDLVTHMHRNPDRAALIGDRPGDRLPDPPGGIGAELVAAPVLELLDRPHQPDVALLDQVQERHAAAHVLLGHADHQARVGCDQVLPGPPAIFDQQAQLFAAQHAHVAFGQLLPGQPAALDALRQVNLLILASAVAPGPPL